MAHKEIAVSLGPIPRPVSNPTKPTAKSFCVLLNRYQCGQLSGIMWPVILARIKSRNRTNKGGPSGRLFY